MGIQDDYDCLLFWETKFCRLTQRDKCTTYLCMSSRSYCFTDRILSKCHDTAIKGAVIRTIVMLEANSSDIVLKDKQYSEEGLSMKYFYALT